MPNYREIVNFDNQTREVRPKHYHCIIFKLEPDCQKTCVDKWSIQGTAFLSTDYREERQWSGAEKWNVTTF